MGVVSFALDPRYGLDGMLTRFQMMRTRVRNGEFKRSKEPQKHVLEKRLHHRCGIQKCVTTVRWP